MAPHGNAKARLSMSGDQASLFPVIVQAKLDLVEPANDNIRRELQGIDELAASVEAVGILEPLIVTEILDTEPMRYRIVAGARRHAAAQKAGLTHVPVIVRELDDRARIEIMLIENLQRFDLTPVEEAVAYQRLELVGLKQREIARRIGRSQSHVSKRVQLLELPERALKAIETNELTLETALDLTKLADTADGRAEIEKIVEAGAQPWRINEAIQRRDREVHRRNLRVKFAQDGIRVVESPEEDADGEAFDAWRSTVMQMPGQKRHAWELLDPSDVEGGMPSIEEHASEPCHAVWIPEGNYGEAFAYFVCTEPARHGFDPSTVFGIDEDPEDEAAAEAREKAKERARAEALDRFDTFVPELLSRHVEGRVPSAPLSLFVGYWLQVDLDPEHYVPVLKLLAVDVPDVESDLDGDKVIGLLNERIAVEPARVVLAHVLWQYRAQLVAAWRVMGGWTTQVFEWLVTQGYNPTAHELAIHAIEPEERVDT
jgi:ParB family chromosome partitioning protein